MAKEFKMSQARYDELKKELDYSKTTRADEVADQRGPWFWRSQREQRV